MSSGVGVELDPSKPLGVGFDLSCERNPMATNLTEGSSALPAWQRPPRVRVECTACVATASCTRVMTNDRERCQCEASAQSQSSSSHPPSTKAPGVLRPTTGVDHFGPRDVYRPVKNWHPLEAASGPSPGCTEMDVDSGSAGSHDPGASNARAGRKFRDAPASIPDLHPFASTPSTAGAGVVEERLKRTPLRTKTKASETCYPEVSPPQVATGRVEPAWKRLKYVFGPIGSTRRRSSDCSLQSTTKAK